eukprot:2013110-Rhodomonas_salina.3
MLLIACVRLPPRLSGSAASFLSRHATRSEPCLSKIVSHTTGSNIMHASDDAVSCVTFGSDASCKSCGSTRPIVITRRRC